MPVQSHRRLVSTCSLYGTINLKFLFREINFCVGTTLMLIMCMCFRELNFCSWHQLRKYLNFQIYSMQMKILNLRAGHGNW